MNYRKNKVAARSLQPHEVELVRKSFRGRHEKRDKALFILLEKTGFRISEALSLRVEDILSNGSLVDVVSVTKENMKGKLSSRSLPLHGEAKQALMEYLSDGPKMGSLFPIKRTRAFKVVQDAFRRAGIPDPHGTHACRKTFCQNVYKRLKNDIFKTCMLMGHKSPETTAKYLSYNEEEAWTAVLASD